MITIAELVVDKLPARADVATRVLCVVDDPASSAVDLAKAVGADPALASRTLALANSAYYGLSGRVSSMDFAVSVIGFNTVRALALTLAAGLDRPGAVPDGFWEQAATCATAASVLAPSFGASAPEAFCLGLLHTIGSAFLHQVLPLPALCLPFPEDPAALAAQERDRYGYGHAAVGAQVLAQWNFPTTMCALIANHHDVLAPDASPLARVLDAARTCADILLTEEGDGPAPEVDPAVLGFAVPDAAPSPLEQIREKAAALQSSLTSV
ncbi:MAG TPA: HDOD domain-containing protein [Sporichthya sp.]|nr:HDOD domain-containing protein [Sporichthya sp.]